jgi:transcriptional regulator GlxA family with amidase domain
MSAARYPAAALAMTEGPEGLVDAALELARRHAATPLSVAHLSRLLGVSRRTLEYAFRRVRSSTPKRALTELRLAEVRRQLEQRTPGAPAALEAVARQSGFASYQAFARAVRCAYAVAPSRLRGEFAKR